MKTRYNDFLKLNEDNNIIISLAEVEKIMLNVFDDTKVSAVNTTYEKDEEINGYKLVITLSNIFYDKTDLIHNKLVFYVDDKKRKVIRNFFHYLYDINCIFKKIKFDNTDDIKKGLHKVFDNRIFGEDLITLSDLNVTLVTKVNEWLLKENIDEISIYSIAYNPVVDVMPCESMFFKFDINIDDIHDIKMNVRKIKNNEYNVTFSENEWTSEEDIIDLKALPQLIGEMIKKHIL